MSISAREALSIAKEEADKAHEAYVISRDLADKEWNKLGYGTKPTATVSSLIKIKGLITDNWKAISAAGVAFGIPVGAADPGAFSKLFGIVRYFLPI